jgi:magnesium transporter
MTERTATLESTLSALAAAKKYSALREVLITMNPSDIAYVFDELGEKLLPLLFRLLPKELAAESFVEMDSDLQELLIRGFSDSELKAVVNEMYIDDAVDLVEEMPANVVKRILQQADPDTRKLINEILKYPEDSAGSIMTTEYVDLRPDMTIREAEDHIRRTGIDKETINTCYVTDRSKRLIGAISIRTIILSDPDAYVRDKMESNVISVTTTQDKEEVALMISKYNFDAMPVVDKENRLVGIVTFDDAFEVITEEATEDIEKMAGMTPSEKPYLKTEVYRLWLNRIPWLLLLMISATFTGLIITNYEHALAAQVALMSFVPMLMDTGGNSGSQSSVTAIRNLSLNEIQFSDLLRVVWKEVRVSLFCGVTLAIAGFCKIMLVDRLILQNYSVTVPVALVVSITLVVVVLVAKVIGCVLPMVAAKVGFDPAVMASPIITTALDALTLLIYFRIATLILRI